MKSEKDYPVCRKGKRDKQGKSWLDPVPEELIKPWCVLLRLDSCTILQDIFSSVLNLTFAGLFRGQSLVEAVTNANATRQSLKFGYSPPGCCPTWLFGCLLLSHHVVGKPLQPGSKDGLGEGGGHAMEPSESLLTF